MVSIHARFTQLCESYLSDVKGLCFSGPSASSKAKSTERTPQQIMRELLVKGEGLWEDILSARLFSSNETLEEYDATILELFWVPFMMADLYQQFQEECPSSRTRSGGGGAASPLSIHAAIRNRSSGAQGREEMERKASLLSSSSAAAGEAGGPVIDPIILRSVHRQEALLRAKTWARTYFEWMENIELFTEEERRKVFRGVFDKEEESEEHGGGGGGRGSGWGDRGTSSDAPTGIEGPGRMSSAFSRQHRLELARTRIGLEKTWKEWEEKFSYYRAKQRRLHQLTREGGASAEMEAEDEDENGDVGEGYANCRGPRGSSAGTAGRGTSGAGGGSRFSLWNAQDPSEADASSPLMEEDNEMVEIRRERALARLRWACYELGYSQEMSQRELQMLSALDLQTRARISKEYQETLEAERRGKRTQGRHTYTILPDGQMMAGTLRQPQPLPVQAVEAGGGGPPTWATATTAPPLPTAVQTSCGVFAQAVRDTLMVDRNPPTATLKEFAEGEMALAMEQQERERAAREAQEEEDARLGPEGVEERERVKASKWDDWKDDNPRNGQTSKGNYS